MAEKTGREKGRQQSTPFDIWEKGGITEHMGGVYATHRLIELCRLASDQTVLLVGCGTGHTACYLARDYRARVVALDISPRSVQEAKERIDRADIRDRITVMQADAHRIACPDHAFDAVIAESVLVFCDAEQVAAEMCRALKPAGVLGVNELTFLKPPPEQLLSLLREALDIRAFQEDEWQSIFTRAGYVDVSSVVRKISLREQLASHVKVDGVRKYLASIVSGVTDAGIRRVFFNRGMLDAVRQFLPCVGYGLYAGKKAP